HWATATLQRDGILVCDADGKALAKWYWVEISALDDESMRGPIRLARGGARLTVEARGFAAALYAAAPSLKPASGRRRLGRAFAAIAASLAAVGAIWWSLPSITLLLVALIPVGAEERLGDRELIELGVVACENAAGQAALDRLIARLTEHADLRFHPKAIVAQFNERGGDKVVNAFALPGGRIVVLRGLIAEAESADEVAGVLGHELTHAIKQHPLRREMEEAGVAVLFETILGYNTTSDAGSLVAGLSFTRAEEREADEGGIELLRQAGISTQGFATFFRRLSAEMRGEPPALLNTHPATAERIAAAEAAEVPGTSPALSAADWEALKHICDGTPVPGEEKPK
ncbi:MAG TPA: M48 family metallopeptidase, partial [Stellaceae bacterium]|nr:M48 family metallopeptidase [Stellaceae bacterium]